MKFISSIYKYCGSGALAAAAAMVALNSCTEKIDESKKCERESPKKTQSAIESNRRRVWNM